MSIMSAPRSTASRAASAIAAGLTTRKLEGTDAAATIDLSHCQGLSVLTDHRPGGDHLGHHHASAEALGESVGTAGP